MAIWPRVVDRAGRDASRERCCRRKEFVRWQENPGGRSAAEMKWAAGLPVPLRLSHSRVKPKREGGQAKAGVGQVGQTGETGRPPGARAALTKALCWLTSARSLAVLGNPGLEAGKPGPVGREEGDWVADGAQAKSSRFQSSPRGVFAGAYAVKRSRSKRSGRQPQAQVPEPSPAVQS